MNVGYIFDNAYVVPAAVSIVSLLMNNREIPQINFYILDDGISEDNKEKLNVLIEQYGRTITFIDVKDVKDLYAGITKYNWNGSYTTYIRLMVNTLLPESCDRIVLIDADTIIDGRIDELEHFELGDNVCAMALEATPQRYHVYSKLGNSELYNTGVIIIDLKKWKEYDVEKSVIDYLVNNRQKNMLTEEDVLSNVLRAKVARIPAEYNFLVQFSLFSSRFYYWLLGWDKLVRHNSFYTLEHLKSANQKVVIYHCIDIFTNRPWQRNNNHPYTSIFDAYLSHSPWKNYSKYPKAMKPRAKVEYALNKYLPSALSGLFCAIAYRAYYGVGALWYYRNDR